MRKRDGAYFLQLRLSLRHGVEKNLRLSREEEWRIDIDILAKMGAGALANLRISAICTSLFEHEYAAKQENFSLFVAAGWIARSFFNVSRILPNRRRCLVLNGSPVRSGKTEKMEMETRRSRKLQKKVIVSSCSLSKLS